LRIVHLMSDKPRPNWLQFHLSTAIVLMFVAGGMYYVNSIKSKGFLNANGMRPVAVILYLQDGTRIESNNDNLPTICGWPFPFCERIGTYLSNWDTLGFCVDLAVTLIVLMATWQLSERIIRRRHRA